MRAPVDLRWGALARRIALLALCLSTSSLLWPAAASAHAVLQSSDPAADSVLARAPSKVTLHFSEGVAITAASVRVLDARGARVDLGDAAHGSSDSVVTVGLHARMRAGSYVVAWQVISADSHPVHGGFLFSVGHTSRIPGSVTAGELGRSGESGWNAAGGVLRWSTYGGMVLAAGGAVLLTLVARHDLPDRRTAQRWLWVGALVGVSAALLQVPQQAALATGLGAGSLFRGGVLHQVLGQGTGWSIAALAAGALAAMGSASSAVPLRAARGLAAASVLLVTAGFILTGHARTTSPTWLSLGADAVHVAAVAVWAGGVPTLWLLLRGRRRADADPVAAADLVGRFSRMASIAILLVGAAGAVLAWREVRSIDALTSTWYGEVLLVKLGVVAVVAALGAYNRQRIVPFVAAKPDRDAGWKRLGAVLRAEAVGLVVVLAVTSVLVNAVPARIQAQADRVFAGTAKVGNGSINLVIDPLRPGPGVVHAYLLDAVGRADDTAQAVTFRTYLPSRSLGPFDTRGVKAGPGHYQFNGTLFTLPGAWTVVVQVRIDRFTQRAAVLHVQVPST